MFPENQAFLNVSHKIVEKYIIGFFKLFGEKIFVKSDKVFPASIKSINPIQKYPHIIEPYACILKIFIFMFLLPIHALIFFGIYSTPKLSQ